MENKALSVLIVDDSALMRNLIGRIVEAEADLELAGKAMNGRFALQKLEVLKPDVIILDLEMPELDGIGFLKERRRLGIDVPVIILSSLARKGAEITMEALTLGASDFIMKPSGSVSEDIHTVGDQLVELIRIYGNQYRAQRGLPRGGLLKKPAEGAAPEAQPNRVTTRISPPAPAALKPGSTERGIRHHGPFQVLVIGISTGGPNALRLLMKDLSPRFSLPIVVVQHMPPGFTQEFARSLDRICPLEVKEAADGDLLRPGRVLIAPGDYHIVIERKSLASIVRINKEAHANGHRPSAGVLFLSAAAAFKDQALALIMTGMGKDGAEELGEVYKNGGMTLAQDQASSVVYGMPRVALELGHVEKVLALEDMPSFLNRLAQEHAPG